jgi:hypothetical protein
MRTGKPTPVTKTATVTARSPRAGSDPTQFTAEDIRGMICNPIYTGLGPYPRIMKDEAWIQAASRMIREEGAEQFLVNLLTVLRETFGVPENTENDS